MNAKFTHLHLHSHFSLLDGANKLKSVVRKAAELKMPALALTDHGNLFGAVQFHDIARKHKNLVYVQALKWMQAAAGQAGGRKDVANARPVQGGQRQAKGRGRVARRGGTRRGKS